MTTKNATTIERLRLLTSYGVKQDAEWIMRDWLQNFMDGMTKKGVQNPIDHVKVEFTDNSMIISAESYFDPEYLMFIGATTKRGDETQIGEKGEGLKITTLLAMRDFGLGVVYTACNDKKSWVAKGLLEPVTVGGKEEKELCFEIEYNKGESRTESAVIVLNNVDVFRQMNYKDWFKHGANPYLDPKLKITDNIYRLPKGKTKGRLFLNGLDRGEDNRLLFTYVWDKKIDGDNDRDRKTVSDQVLNKVMQSILTSNDLPIEVAETIMRKKEEDITGEYSYNPEASGLRSNPKIGQYFEMVFRKELEFYTYSQKAWWERRETSFLNRIGMKQITNNDIITHISNKLRSVEQITDEEAKGKEVKAKDKYLERIKILKTIAKFAGLPQMEIKMFLTDTHEQMVRGTYNGSYVRISQDTMDRTFGECLSVYLHEMAHEFGSDESATFSDKLTEYMGRVFGMNLDGDCRQGMFLMLLNAEKNW